MSSKNSIVKRSMTIAGHRTSIALEPEFWGALAECASRYELSVPKVIEHIDAGRGDRALASAIRVTMLAYYRGHADRDKDHMPDTPEPSGRIEIGDQ